MGELFGATGAAPKYKFTPSGAPRSMKVSTIASPWRYDVAADYALQSVNLRRPTILRYASWAADFPFRRVLATLR
jgi:hypothetical protein